MQFWRVINRTLKTLDFSDDAIKGVETLQKKSTTIVIQNVLSKEIYLGRGCQQGDPVSHYTFILAGEILGIMISENQNIKGIFLHNDEHWISLYANKTSLLLEKKEEYLREVSSTLDPFYEISGLKVNVSKIRIMQIGVGRDSRTEFCKCLKQDWTDTYDYLGIS